MTTWTSEDLDLMIDEGRRQLDTQQARLDSVINRAQLVLAINLTLVALLATGLSKLLSEGDVVGVVAWAVAAAFIILALLGSAAVIVVRKDMGIIESSKLSSLRPPIRLDLARAYARAVRAGEHSIAREVTVSRDAVLLTLLGVLIYGVTWCFVVAA